MARLHLFHLSWLGLGNKHELTPWGAHWRAEFRTHIGLENQNAKVRYDKQSVRYRLNFSTPAGAFVISGLTVLGMEPDAIRCCLHEVCTDEQDVKTGMDMHKALVHDKTLHLGGGLKKMPKHLDWNDQNDCSDYVQCQIAPNEDLVGFCHVYQAHLKC